MSAVVADGDHGPGCNCGGCQPLTFNGHDAFALSLPNLVVPDTGNGPKAPPFPESQTFLLESLPGATKTIYLDFDGHTTVGTWWNSNGNSWYNDPFTIDGNFNTFNTAEHEVIQNTWRMMAEDFAPFNVNVTTKDPTVADPGALIFSGGNDQTWGIRVIICDNEIAAPGAGGVAFVPSFKTGIDNGCFVYSGNLGNSAKNITEAGSHEVGHTLGLGHDGTSSQGYYGGHNGGTNPVTPGWAPIMGVGYYQGLSQWSRGEYPNANNTQDDLSIITNTNNNFGYKPDDAGNNIAGSVPLTIVGNNASFSGLISQTNDVDYLRFSTAAGTVSFTVNNFVIGPNLDVGLEIRDSNNAVVASANDLAVLDATITANLPAGTYYLVVDGVGVGNPGTNGYSDYGSLGQYTVAGTVITGVSVFNLESSALTFTENAPDLNLSSSVQVTDDGNIGSATVTITAGYANGQDVLVYTAADGITGNFDAGTGRMTLTGTATPAAYTAALRRVRYRNLSEAPATAARTLSFQAIDAQGNASGAVTRTLNVLSVNDTPTLAPIANITIDEDAGVQSIDLLGISDGNEGQTLSFSTFSSNGSLVGNPGVNFAGGPTGTLNFAPAPNQFGTTTITVTLMDDGGTANGGVNTVTRQFTITVNSVNDAPIFVPEIDPFLPKNAPAQSLPNWPATAVPGPANESGQTLSYQVSNDNNGLFSQQPLLSPSGTLTFTPAANATGVALVTVVASDNGGTANGGDDVADPVTFYIFIGVNRSPYLDPNAGPELNPTGEDAQEPNGTLVGDFAFPGYVDLDVTDGRGIAVTGTNDNADGAWQYTLDDGLTWFDLEAATEANARLLAAEDRVRFVPNLGYVGRPSLTFHGWDQTTGLAGDTADVSTRGGSTAFSNLSDTARVRIAPLLASFTEDVKNKGSALSPYTTVYVDDIDLAARGGLAVIAAGGDLPGVWQYSTNKGRTWKPLGDVSSSAARLLRDTDRVRFVQDPNASGDAYLKFHAWDQSVGVAGSTAAIVGGPSSPFSDTSDYLVVRVARANDRPALDSSTVVPFSDVDPLAANEGDRVGDLLGSAVTDVDVASVPGMAVIKGANEGGSWEFKIGGGVWTAMPAVSKKAAFLLGPDDRLRFVPDDGFNGVAQIQFKAWDQSTTADAGAQVKIGKDSAFSKAAATLSLVVGTSGAGAQNASPVLDNTGFITLTPSDEDTKPAGDRVGDLLGAKVTDADSGALSGIALVGVTGARDGTWQWSANGRTWKPVGPVGLANALLLRDTDFLRFLPNKDYSGPVTVTFHAWDQTRGTAGKYANLQLPGTTGGSTPFSVDAEFATGSVVAVNDAPVLNTKGKIEFTSILPSNNNSPGNSVAELLGSRVTDVDTATQAGIAVIKLGSKMGTWQYSIDGGTSWQNAITTAAISADNALFLRPQDRLRLQPFSGLSGTDKIWFKAWDRTTDAAGDHATTVDKDSVSKAVATATIAVNDDNDRPVLDKKPDVRFDPVAAGDDDPAGNTVASLLAGRVDDPDPNAVTGIAVFGAVNVGGQWEYSLDGGNNWLPLAASSIKAAFVLRATDLLRFKPSDGFNGTAQISYKAWDQSYDGTAIAGSYISATTASFSKASETASISVNNAPTLL